MKLSVLRTDARYLISPQLTSAEYPDADVDRNINLWYRRAIIWAILAQGTWQVRGTYANYDTQVGKMNYPVPAADLIRILRVEIKYTAAGDFVQCVPTDIFQSYYPEANATRINDSANSPTVDLSGSEMIIRPAPNEAVVNGLQIWLQRTITDLVNVDDIPDLLDPIHRLLAYGAAHDFAIAEEMYRKAQELKVAIFGTLTRAGFQEDGIKHEIEDLYTIREGRDKPRMVAKKRNFR